MSLHEPGADDLGDDDGGRHATDPIDPGGRASDRRHRRDRSSPRDRRGRACRDLSPGVRHHCRVPDQPAVPQHCPSPRELDDLELLAHGALGLSGFEGPDGLVTLTVPTEVAAAAQDAGCLELVDPEGLPLARVEVRSTYDAGGRTGLTGPVTPLTHHEFGAFRRLYLTPTQVRRGVRRAHADRPGRRTADRPGPGSDPVRGRRPARAAARAHRDRHARGPLGRRPGPGHPGGGAAPEGRVRGRGPARLAGRRGGRPPAGTAGRRRVRTGRRARGRRRGRPARRRRRDRRA